MVKDSLKAGKDVPSNYHVARYCFPNTVRFPGERSSRPVVTHRAFEWRGDGTADLSFSVTEWFRRNNASDEIFEVCRHRGCLKIRDGGHYVKLNVGIIVNKRYGADRRNLHMLFEPGKNPAHATLYTGGLMVSLELASLASEKGEFFPVPNPIPEVALPD